MDENVINTMADVVEINLQKIREEQNNPIRIKIINLRKRFEVIKEGQRYHRKIFSFLGTGKHYAFKEELTEQKLLNFYYDCQEILANIQGKDDLDIEYVIYYSDKKGTHRIKMNHIPKTMLRYHAGGGKNDAAQLRLTATKSVLEKMAKQQIEDRKLIEHFENYKTKLINSYKGIPGIPNATISLGRITEAFERHLKNYQHEETYSDDIDITSAWLDIRRSMGNAAWYTGGDVDNLQVKSLITGDRGLFNLNTIEDLINFFDYLISPASDAQNNEEIVKNFKKIVQQDDIEISEALKQKIKENAQAMTKEILTGK